MSLIKLTAIGYWKSCYQPELPDPADFINSDWDSNERKKVIEHLQKSPTIAEWMGISWCRFRCGEINLGAKCLTDGVYIYPEGLIHYILKHNLKLPESFTTNILSYKGEFKPIDYKNVDIDYSWWKNEKGTGNTKKVKSFLAATDSEIEAYERRTTANNI